MRSWGNGGGRGVSDGLWAFVCPRILGFDIIMLDDRLHKVRRLFDGFWELPQGFPGPTFNVLGSWTVPVVQQSGRFPGFLLFFFALCRLNGRKSPSEEKLH